MIQSSANVALRFPAVRNKRSSIARALIKNAPILILDDSLPLSTPIQKNISYIISGDDRKGKTTTLDCTPISTVQHADLIMVLENGGNERA